MAGRDYILCRDCGDKLIYDGSDNIRSYLEENYGDPSAPGWTVQLVCPPCLKKIEDKQAERVVEPSFVISPTRMTWDEAMAWAEGLGMRLATVAEMRGISLPAVRYWSGTEYSQSDAWLFFTNDGFQNYDDKGLALFAVAVAKRAEPVVVISPPAELKYVISPKRMGWDDAVAWAAGQGLRLATVAEMREWSLPADFYWSGTEFSQSNAWFFGTFIGFQYNYDKNCAFFAVAVAKQADSGNPSY
jgi:hypothetical protein